MRSSSIFSIATSISIVAALATPLAAPIPHFDISNITIAETGHSGPLSKRSTVPSECQFQGARTEFFYVKLNVGNGHTSCIGMADDYDCGPGLWAANEFHDLELAMQEQVGKDGWSTSSTAGWWTATFATLTSAFTDRDASTLFYAGIEIDGIGKDRKYKWYFFSYDYNFANVMRSHGCTNA